MLSLQIRANFGKWVTRPKRSSGSAAAPPTFVWVIENPDGCVNAHWLVHIPPARQREFAVKLDKWLGVAAGDVYSDTAIDIRPAKTPTAAGKYMLKGLHPSLAKEYGIRHVYQGWVTGKRIGCSMNIGPAQLARMRKLGKHPAASRWIHGKYSRHQQEGQAFK